MWLTPGWGPLTCFPSSRAAAGLSGGTRGLQEGARLPGDLVPASGAPGEQGGGCVCAGVLRTPWLLGVGRGLEWSRLALWVGRQLETAARTDLTELLGSWVTQRTHLTVTEAIPRDSLAHRPSAPSPAVPSSPPDTQSHTAHAHLSPAQPSSGLCPWGCVLGDAPPRRQAPFSLVPESVLVSPLSQACARLGAAHGKGWSWPSGVILVGGTAPQDGDSNDG